MATTEISIYKSEIGQPVTDSKNVADIFGKRHDHVLRDIEEIIEKSREFGDLPKIGEMYIESQIPDAYGRPQRAFLMNRDGFSLLAMGFTGSKALQWKLKYIEAFNKMEATLSDPILIPRTHVKAPYLNVKLFHGTPVVTFTDMYLWHCVDLSDLRKQFIRARESLRQNYDYYIIQAAEFEELFGSGYYTVDSDGHTRRVTGLVALFTETAYRLIMSAFVAADDQLRFITVNLRIPAGVDPAVNGPSVHIYLETPEQTLTSAVDLQSRIDFN